jgi:hypothetical protein
VNVLSLSTSIWRTIHQFSPTPHKSQDEKLKINLNSTSRTTNQKPSEYKMDSGKVAAQGGTGVAGTPGNNAGPNAASPRRVSTSCFSRFSVATTHLFMDTQITN